MNDTSWSRIPALSVQGLGCAWTGAYAGQAALELATSEAFHQGSYASDIVKRRLVETDASSIPHRLPTAIRNRVYGHEIAHPYDTEKTGASRLFFHVLNSTTAKVCVRLAFISSEQTTQPRLEVVSPIEQTLRLFREIDLDEFDAKIKGFAALKSGWDSYRAAPPTAEAILQSREFLAVLRKLRIVPSKVTPSLVGGIGVTFRRGERSVYVEFRNTGKAHAAFIDEGSEQSLEDSSGPIVQSVSQTRASYMALMEQAEKYLNEQPARGDEG